jgi:hypothetical protein
MLGKKEFITLYYRKQVYGTTSRPQCSFLLIKVKHVLGLNLIPVSVLQLWVSMARAFMPHVKRASAVTTPSIPPGEFREG